jgi:hypothetical protein
MYFVQQACTVAEKNVSFSCFLRPRHTLLVVFSEYRRCSVFAECAVRDTMSSCDIPVAELANNGRCAPAAAAVVYVPLILFFPS